MATQFLNSMYKRARRGYDDQQRKYVVVSPDVLIYTTKDTETLETTLHFIERPKVDFYIANKPQGFHKISIPKNEARRISVPFSDRSKEIAQCLGTLEQFYKSSKNGSLYEYNRNTLKNPNLYLADMDVEDFTKTKYIIQEGDEVVCKNYKMAFSDIEVDISNLEDDFPEPKIAPSPVNLVTTIYADTKDLYTFILFDPRVEQDIAWIAQNQDLFVNEYLDEDIRKEGFNIHINVYRTEMDLLRAYFSTIHEHKPDFMAWWNMPFDIPTIINRMKRNGLTEEQIADIMCHPEVPKKYRYYKYNEDPKRRLYEAGEDIDEEEEKGKSKNAKQKPHPSRLIDWVEIPGYTQHYDQLSMFSCLRKRTLYPSYKLDVIGEMFAGQRKLNLEDAGYNIKDVNIKNFKLFVAYNIRDVFVQYCLEKKQRDMYQYVIFADNTRLSKGDSSSIVIKNKLMLYLWNKGEIMGNAIDYETNDSIPGAIVGRPELIEQFGIPVSGKPSFVFENAIDLDASSLYPSLMIMFNIFKSALFGHVKEVVVPDKTAPDGNRSLGSGEGLFGDLQCVDQAIFTIASRYMSLPTPEDIMQSINKGAETKARLMNG